MVGPLRVDTTRKRFVVGDERGWYVVDGATGRVQQVSNVPGPPIGWVGATSG